MNLRGVRWYEHIDGRSDRSNLVEFEKWLCKRVETLFNPLEDFISEEWSKKQRSTKSKPSSKINPLTTTTEISPDTPGSNNDLSDRKQTPNQSPNKELEKNPLQLQRRVLFARANTLWPIALSSSLSTCKKGENSHGNRNFVLTA